jgi:hypothetical protein
MNEMVYCEKGVVDIHGGRIYPRNGEARDVDPEPSGESTQAAVNDFFRCIREKDEPLANAEAGRNGALTGLLGRMALDEERVVTMKELLAQG